jgi:tetratricopeptide (TPR) repeat protein
MKRSVILFLTILLLKSGMPLFALDHNNVRYARNLLKENRFNEALALYSKMIKNATSVKEKQSYVELAVKAALSSKKPDKAKELVELIKDPMRENYVFMKYFPPQQVIEKSAALDLATMPEDIISDAYALRGLAYKKLKNNVKALEDFKKAFEFKGGRKTGEAYKYAADISLLNDDKDNAEAFYKKAIESTPGAFAWRCRAIISLSELLITRDNAKEALTLFPEKLFKRASRHNKMILYSAKAEVLKKLSKNSEALDALEAAVKNADERSKKSLQEQINKLAEDMM